MAASLRAVWAVDTLALNRIIGAESVHDQTYSTHVSKDFLPLSLIQTFLTPDKQNEMRFNSVKQIQLEI